MQSATEIIMRLFYVHLFSFISPTYYNNQSFIACLNYLELH